MTLSRDICGREWLSWWEASIKVPSTSGSPFAQGNPFSIQAARYKREGIYHQNFICKFSLHIILPTASSLKSDDVPTSLPAEMASYEQLSLPRLDHDGLAMTLTLTYRASSSLLFFARSTFILSNLASV